MPHTTLTLTLRRTTMGAMESRQFFQVYVTDPEGASVVIDFSFEDANDSIMCIGDASQLQGVYSGSHLCALVGTFLWDRFDADHEFLSDVFLDAEFKDFVSLSMPVNLPNYAGV